MNEVINNIKTIQDKYKDKVKTNRHLLLLYWKEYDGLRFNGQYISTQDFLKDVTPATDIINGKMMLDILEREGVDK